MFHYSSKPPLPKSAEDNSTRASGSNPTGAGTPSGDDNAAREEATTRQENHSITLNPNSITLGIVPARIRAKGGKKVIEGYAFLDNGSTGTIGHDDLFDAIDADGRQSLLEVETVHGKSKGKS